MWIEIWVNPKFLIEAFVQQRRYTEMYGNVQRSSPCGRDINILM